MQFVVEPGRVWLGPISWVFLFYLCLLLPFGAYRQHRVLTTPAAGGGARPMPSRGRLYVSALATHLFFIITSFAVAQEVGVNFLPPYSLTPWHAVVGLLSLGLGLFPLTGLVKLADSTGRERAKLLAPRTRRDHALWYVVSASAGFAEELAYRGVLFTLLAKLAGGWWVAALAASALFGVVHLFQGWRSAGLAALIGLRDHIVVGLTGTLFVAIVVHAIHDAVAGTVIAHKATKAERQAATTPETAHAVS